MTNIHRRACADAFNAMLAQLVDTAAEALKVQPDAVCIRYTADGWDCHITLPPPPRKRHAHAVSAATYHDSPAAAVDDAIDRALFAVANGFAGAS